VRGALSFYLGMTGHDLTFGGVRFIARWKARLRMASSRLIDAPLAFSSSRFAQ